MSKERYAEHTVAWELPNGDSVTKSNYNLATIETKYMPIQTEVISDNKDKTIDELQQRIAELEEQLKNYTKPKFKLKQCVYYIFDGFVGFFKPEYVVEVRDACVFGIEIYEDGIKYATSYGLFSEDELFATKEEAEAKLRELQGEKR